MMRLMFCFVRQSSLPRSEFRAYWRSEEHKEKIQSLVDLFKPDRFTDTLAVHMPDIEGPVRNTIGRGTQYDAVVEFYWDDEEIVRERLADKAVAQILKVLRDQSAKRVDPNQTTIFLTEIPEVQYVDNRQLASA